MMNIALCPFSRILYELFQETNKNIKLIGMTLEIYLVYIIVERKYVFSGIIKGNYFEK